MTWRTMHFNNLFFFAQKIFIYPKSKSDFDKDPMGVDPMKDPLKSSTWYKTLVFMGLPLR